MASDATPVGMVSCWLCGATCLVVPESNEPVAVMSADRALLHPDPDNPLVMSCRECRAAVIEKRWRGVFERGGVEKFRRLQAVVMRRVRARNAQR